MANKKFLYGLGIGILGCNLYPLVKGKIRPMAIKIVEGAIGAGSITKASIEEINEKAMEHRQDRFKRESANFEQKQIKNNDELVDNMESLKKQLEELKTKFEGV